MTTELSNGQIAAIGVGSVAALGLFAWALSRRDEPAMATRRVVVPEWQRLAAERASWARTDEDIELERAAERRAEQSAEARFMGVQPDYPEAARRRRGKPAMATTAKSFLGEHMASEWYGGSSGPRHDPRLYVLRAIMELGGFGTIDDVAAYAAWDSDSVRRFLLNPHVGTYVTVDNSLGMERVRLTPAGRRLVLESVA